MWYSAKGLFFSTVNLPAVAISVLERDGYIYNVDLSVPLRDNYKVRSQVTIHTWHPPIHSDFCTSDPGPHLCEEVKDSIGLANSDSTVLPPVVQDMRQDLLCFTTTPAVPVSLMPVHTAFRKRFLDENEPLIRTTNVLAS